MSADNWTQCPRCKRRHEVELDAKVREVAEAYGRVSVERFDDLRTEVDRMRSTEIDSTLREDWEIGVFDDGVLFIDYKGRCQSCNLQVTFSHEQVVDVSE